MLLKIFCASVEEKRGFPGSHCDLRDVTDPEENDRYGKEGKEQVRGENKLWGERICCHRDRTD